LFSSFTSLSRPLNPRALGVQREERLCSEATSLLHHLLLSILRVEDRYLGVRPRGTKAITILATAHAIKTAFPAS